MSILVGLLEMRATMAIVKGFHEDHGTAVYLAQGKGPCLLISTTYGLSNEEVSWKILADWASFPMSFACL
jgi:hypothetical protein